MAKQTSSKIRRSVLACLSAQEDLKVLQSVLRTHSAEAVTCLDIPELCGKISDQIETAFIGIDRLSKAAIQQIAQALERQPDWSDLPIVVSVAGGAESSAAMNAMHSLGNVFVLDHPPTPAALKNMFLAAFRSRERQRWIRDLMTECEHATLALQESKRQLELKVKERTGELAESAAQLRRLTGELIISEQRERRRLAKILHDHLQQILVSAKYRIASLQTQDPTVRVAVQEVDELLEEVIEDSRSLISELMPPIVHERGLRTGMEWLVSFMAAQHGFSVQLSMNEDFSHIDENTKILVFDSIRELLINALRHSKVQSAEASIRRTGGNKMEAVVSDQGTGFDPSSALQGGFGLFRIRHRVELTGGSMAVESAPGKGSRISFTLPLQEVLSVPTGAGLQAGTAFPGRMEKPLGSMIRLLIVDDHAVMRQGLSTSLGQEPDIAIIGEAADGKKALERARELNPDAILMDLGMPKMGGIEATRIIHAEMPRVRIIGLSMFEEQEQANAMLEAGAVAYLNKSCSVDVLTSTIRFCVGRSRLSRANMAGMQ